MCMISVEKTKPLVYVSLFVTAAMLALTSTARAEGQQPVVRKIPLEIEVFQVVRVSDSDEAFGGVAAAADSEVSAPIYRSVDCGFLSWFSGQPAWLDQLILFNEGGLGAQLRSITVPVCFDTCHRGNRCLGQGGAEDCDCLAPGDLPIVASFQLYDGNPCDVGVQIAGAGGMATITTDMLPDAQIGDGESNCFDLTVVVDPKIMIPHEVWIEVDFGHEDAWPIFGQPAQFSSSPLSGLNDGVDCMEFCDAGDPILCRNDPDGCDWIQTNLDSNAEILVTLQPVLPPAETIWAKTSTYSVVGDEAIMPAGGDRVFFDVMLSDWDPGGVNGTQLAVWQAEVDSSGYNSGLQGTLSPATGTCVEDVDCETQMGIGSRCGDTSFKPDQCTPAFINNDRSDGLQFKLSFCNLSTQDYYCAASIVFGSVGSPGQESYLWTLALDVPSNAAGTFTIDMKAPPDTILFSEESGFLPLIGVVPGKVTIPAGSCCYDLDSQAPACADALLADQCDALPGPRIFTLDAVCDGGCTAGRCCFDLFSAEPPCADSLQPEECAALPGPTHFLRDAVCGGTCTTIPSGRCCHDLDSAEPGCSGPLSLEDCDALPGPRSWLQDGVCDGTCTACLPSSPPLAEKIGFEVLAKNRFLSVEVGDPGRLQALRVTAVSLAPPYDVWNGQQWFAGTPIQVCENSGQGIDVPIEECGPSPGLGRRWFWAVPLVCNEALIHYADWSTMGTVHLFHEGIVPSRLAVGGRSISIPSVYEVQAIDRNCDSAAPGNFSDPLSFTQSAWGDMVDDCMECPCSVPDNRVDVVTDVVSLWMKFANSFCAPPKAITDHAPLIPDFKVSVVEVFAIINAFQGLSYPYEPEDPCR